MGTVEHPQPSTGTGITLASEVFIATALLHREYPERKDFTISEIVNRAEKENLWGELRKGVRVHASLHCVANKPPNPARHRMLYATGLHTRRLLCSSDRVYPGRTGKIWPDVEDVPPQYLELIDWAKNRFSVGGQPSESGLSGILKMRGMGRDLWRDEDPDEYVRKLREGWE